MVTSQKQLDANRRNAQLSTGPRTQAGKNAVRFNAVTHGLLARAVVITGGAGGEDPEEFAALLDELRTDLAPVGALEEMLVEKIAVSYWRMHRAQQAEVAELRGGVDSVEGRLAAQQRDRLQRDLKIVRPASSLLTGLERVPRSEEALAAARQNLTQYSAGLKHVMQVVETMISELERESWLSPDQLEALGRLRGAPDGGVVQRLCAVLPSMNVPPDEDDEDDEDVPLLPPDQVASALHILREEHEWLAQALEATYADEASTLAVQLTRLTLPTPTSGEVILRYETMYERQFYRAMNELTRMQDRRKKIGTVAPEGEAK